MLPVPGTRGTVILMPESQTRDRVLGLSRGLWVGLLVIVAVGIGAGWMMFARLQPPDVSRPVETARVAPAGTFAPAAQPAAPTPSPVPRFDIARIGPDGNAVIAGRAAPGATVTVLDGDRPLGSAQANGRGEFVFLPDTPLHSGARTLRLRQAGPDGSQVEGADALVLVVPPHADETRQPALAVLTPPQGTPRVLQGPGQDTQAGPSRLGLAVIDYGSSGDIRFGGSAPPGATVRLYVDNQAMGEATADAAGQWSHQPAHPITAGDHELRLDQLSANGQVSARLTVPFRRETPLAMSRGMQPGGQVVVQPGDSLWLLARQTYGAGIRYTAIFAANRTQIRDPDLIYPGQAFSMPAIDGTGSRGAPAASSNTSSSSSRSR